MKNDRAEMGIWRWGFRVGTRRIYLSASLLHPCWLEVGLFWIWLSFDVGRLDKEKT